MAVSTFLGYFSLKSGVIFIGLLQLFGALFICQFQPYLAYGDPTSFWTPILALQMVVVLFLFIGINNRHGDYVFTFVCLFCVTVMLLIYTTTEHVLWNIWDVNRLQFEWLAILLKIVITSIMYYFMQVIYAFYKELLHEEFICSSSTSSANYIDTKNNEEIHKQAIKQILAEEGIAESYDNIKK